MSDLVGQLKSFAAGCRGSMWQSRDRTIALCDEAAAEIAALQARNAALVEALRVADVEILENVRAFKGVASDIRAAIAAARGE